MRVVRTSATRRTRPSVVVVCASTGLACVLLVALLGPYLAPHAPTEQVGLPFESPDAKHVLGTDMLGRDVLSRVLHGGRTIVIAGVCATAATTVLGTLVGLWAAFTKTRAGDLLVRLVDVLAAVPALLSMLVLAAGFPGSDTAVVVAVALTTLPFSVRVVRASGRRLAGHGYIEAARARGDSASAVLRYDVLPNMVGPLLTDAGIRLVAAVHLSATAGFLGLGQGAPAANWGRMVQENLPGASLTTAPFLAPTLLLVVFAVSVNLLADRVSESFGREAA
ncbi:ABC transporter permease [Streptomyces sp. SID3343]|uniref:ABC transporter permease n=1 Tax=Streptomyces sp. SID3343 TaxID=2690260 RepID=UPI00136EE7DC|nr:ABC transporter permease [Streptomyces sp. SID3343]MYW01363.1 ABC transporter permease subunit [Streptomyces sp. SID3343]MYW02890.1 ABC transporter permease subunit [Streptomyces sp. SID3343]